MGYEAAQSEGVWSHSAPTRKHIIFAVSPTTETMLHDKLRAILAYANLYNLPIKPVIGSWKGKLEHAFVMSEEGFNQVWGAGFLRDEDAWIELGEYDARDRRKATLVWADGDRNDLGWFGSVPEVEARRATAWTYDPVQGLYFQAKHAWPIPYHHPGLGDGEYVFKQGDHLG